jgi:uncharacterized C2H2 Zn-finger protein
LNRKNICPSYIEDIDIEEVKFMYNLCDEPKITQNHPILNPKKPKITQNEPKITQNNPFSKNGKNFYNCMYCNKVFKRNWHLDRHLKTCKMKTKCDDKKTLEELKDKVEDLIIQLSNQTNKNNKILNTTNNNNTNNTNTSSNNTNTNNNNKTLNNNSNNVTQHITINNYGEENLKCLTEAYLTKLIKGAFTAIPKLIEKIHFNPEYPENQNIKITNKKEPYIKVLKNDKWELQDKEETITDLIDRQQVHLLDEGVEKKIEKSCSNTEKVNIERCNDLYNEENKDYMKRLYNESELIIINNSS